MNGPEIMLSSFRHCRDNQPQFRTVAWEQLARRLTRHRERAEKDGELWSPTYYPPGTRRAKENVEQLTCLVLDIDDGTPPEVFEEAWAPYVYVLHSTYSHTAAYPKWRAVFPLATSVWAQDWPHVWETLANALAPDRYDTGCSDASRIYYLPACPLGDTDRFARIHDGERLDPKEFTPPAAPPTRPRIRAAPPAESGAPPPPRRPPGARVSSEVLIEYALRTIVLEELIGQGHGRHCGTLWLMCQLRDNGYDSEEGARIGEAEWLPRLPETNTKGEQALYTAAELATVWRDIYSKPAREPWTLRQLIPDPPEELAPSERGGGTAEANGAPLRGAEGGMEPHRALQGGEMRAPPPIPPPSGTPAAVAPVLKIPPRQRRPDAHPSDFGALYNLAGLQHTPCPPPAFVVEELMPVGCTELFGSAKIGKTFAALGIAIPVSLGGMALSRFPCQQGEVLYIAAEDAPWRMKDRAGHLLVDIPSWPPGFWIDHEWGLRMSNQGFGKLEDWLDARRATKMVILDPWHALRVPYPRGADIVSLDYEAFKRLNLLGTQAECTMLVLHHASKRTGEDGITNASGSHGIGAGAGTILEFRRIREQHTAQLVVSGRDAKNECTWSLQRDERTGHWSCLGDAGEIAANENRLAVWDCLAQGGAMRPKAIADATGLALPTVYSLCARMVKAGELRGGGGGYTAGQKPGTKEERL